MYDNGMNFSAQTLQYGCIQDGLLGNVISLGIKRKEGIMKVLNSPKFPRVLRKPGVKKNNKGLLRTNLFSYMAWP